MDKQNSCAYFICIKNKISVKELPSTGELLFKTIETFLRIISSVHFVTQWWTSYTGALIHMITACYDSSKPPCERQVIFPVMSA